MPAEFVEVVHPDIEGSASVPRTGLRQHALAGWRLKSEPTTSPAPPEES